MVMILVSTNLPAEKFSEGSGKAKEIVASVSKHFDIKPEHIVLGFHPDGKYWFRDSDAPIFNVQVVAPAAMMEADKMEKAIQLMTKAVQENFPDVSEDRVLIFFRAHDPSQAGISGQTMLKYYQGL